MSLLVALLPTSLFAEKKSAPRLFPDNTFGYIRIDDTREMKAKMEETNIGRLTDDPQIKPILKEFYGTIVDSLKDMQSSIGINLDELLSIPNGELAVAVYPTKTRPAVSVLLEAGDEMPPVEILLARLEDELRKNGAIQKTKDVAGIKIVQWADPDRRERQVGYFIDSGCLVATSQVEEIERLAMVWTGNATDFKPLADNRRFTNIMSRCVGAAGERPQASYFVDPIAIFKEAMKSNPNGGMTLAFLPIIGVDGIQGLGGSMILRTDEFDSIVHNHLLVASPRKSLMQVLRPKSGSTEPESWVSEDIGTYATFNWDLKKTLSSIARIVGEEVFEEQVIKTMSDRMGVDFQKDIIDNINDRFSLVQIFIRPAKINSGSNIYCIHLKNGKTFAQDILPKLHEKFKGLGPGIESTTLDDIVIYQMKIPNRSEAVRAPEPCAAVIGDMLLISDARTALDKAIYTYKGQHEILADSLEYKLVRDKIKKQLGDRETSIISFQRPEESLRLFYDLAADPKNKDRMKEMSENNPFFRAISNSLERHKLPPFETLSKYMAPTGAFLYEDETGFHSTQFSMRRDK